MSKKELLNISYREDPEMVDLLNGFTRIHPDVRNRSDLIRRLVRIGLGVIANPNDNNDTIN